MMWFFTEKMLVGKCRAMTLIRSSSNVKTMGKDALSLCTLSHGYYDHVQPNLADFFHQRDITQATKTDDIEATNQLVHMIIIPE